MKKIDFWKVVGGCILVMLLLPLIVMAKEIKANIDIDIDDTAWDKTGIADEDVSSYITDIVKKDLEAPYIDERAMILEILVMDISSTRDITTINNAIKDLEKYIP